MRIASASIVFLFCTSTCLVTSGCRSQNEDASQAKSAAAVMLTSTVIQWLLDKALEIPVQRRIEDIFDSFEKDNQELGNVEANFSKALSSKLKLDLDNIFQREIEIKLNTLQSSIRHDYVPGLAESTVQLALMGEKSSEILSALESYAANEQDMNRIGMALANYHTYILATSIRIFVHSERLRIATTSLGKDATPVMQLRKAIQAMAKNSLDYTKKLETSLADQYAKNRLMAYEYEQQAEQENFGYKLNVRYSYCVKSSSKKRLCGPQSTLVCANEIALECVTAARKEARESFEKGKTDQPLLDAFRLEIFEDNLKSPTDRLEKLSKRL
jgi:hypothetical protein